MKKGSLNRDQKSNYQLNKTLNRFKSQKIIEFKPIGNTFSKKFTKTTFKPKISPFNGNQPKLNSYQSSQNIPINSDMFSQFNNQEKKKEILPEVNLRLEESKNKDNGNNSNHNNLKSLRKINSEGNKQRRNITEKKKENQK